jgi:hypothetical protein
MTGLGDDLDPRGQSRLASCELGTRADASPGSSPSASLPSSRRSPSLARPPDPAAAAGRWHAHLRSGRSSRSLSSTGSSPSACWSSPLPSSCSSTPPRTPSFPGRQPFSHSSAGTSSGFSPSRLEAGMWPSRRRPLAPAGSGRCALSAGLRELSEKEGEGRTRASRTSC